MNRILLVVLGWIALGLETGIRDVFALGRTAIAPSFVVPLAVFVAMHATPSGAAWCALGLGVMLDLTASVDLEAGRAPAFVVGPHALGLLLGVQAVLALRGIVMRRNPIAMVFLCVVACAAMEVFVVFSHSIRAAYDPIEWSPTRELAHRLGSSLYTGGTGLAAWFVLGPMAGLMGFAGAAGGARWARRAA